MSKQVGYCTNVHPGVTLDEVKTNLEKFAIPVRDSVADGGVLPVGLWLSQTAAGELDSEQSKMELRDWLLERRLDAFTFNGFPFGDFHQAVVKHSVYNPTWAETTRLEYTRRLADVQATLLSDDAGTISTLPLGWPDESTDESFESACAENLLSLVTHLAKLESETGKSIRVCIEPEPGCVLDTAADLVNFFRRYLLESDEAELVRRHLGVCHDICHSAVMFETQHQAVELYTQAGIEIGKVQVSSAVQANFDSADDMQKAWMLKSLAEFAEPKYLHQTCVAFEGKVAFHEDLSLAIEAVEEMPQGIWRVHFHVPIFQQTIGDLQTTQSDILELIGVLNEQSIKPQWEVETYAWSVLPEDLRHEALDQSIAREIRWFAEQI